LQILKLDLRKRQSSSKAAAAGAESKAESKGDFKGAQSAGSGSGSPAAASGSSGLELVAFGKINKARLNVSLLSSPACV
jgi:hypothetical protein